MTRAPERIWTGDWRAQSEEARRAAAAARTPARAGEAQPATTPAATPPRPSRSSHRRARRARAMVAGCAAVLLIAAGALGGVLAFGGGDTESLPAASGPAVKASQGQTRAGAVYASASPAVVSIRAGSATGTGFLIDRDGRVVTNAHVVQGNDRVEVRFGADGDSIEGQVRGTDPSSDLAVVEIDPGQLPAGVRPLRLADSRDVQVGDVAIAIGNPFGLDRTATEGIVSGIGREIQAPNGFSIDSVIQTDAPINPGNSGGPLLDESGRVIGVNSQIETGGSQGNVGIGFAVPSNTVREVVPALTRGEQIERAYLGVQTTPASTSSQSGAEVQSVVSGGPADRTGIRRGDVITAIDGEDVGEPSDVTRALSDDTPGKVVVVELSRNGSDMTVRATLGTRPAASTP
jgi:putative serine protease PepD